MHIGGNEVLSFLSFEGKVNSSVPVALEITDIAPDDWPENLTKNYRDVISDAAKWARFCQDEFKPDMICLRLIGTHPDRGEGQHFASSGHQTVPGLGCLVSAISIQASISRSHITSATQTSRLRMAATRSRSTMTQSRSSLSSPETRLPRRSTP